MILVLTGLDLSIVATAIPSLTDHFRTVSDVGWYFAAYQLTACAFQFQFGKLFSIFNQKWVFLVSVTIFMSGSTVTILGFWLLKHIRSSCAVRGCADCTAQFILGRAVTGLGVSGVIAGCFTLLVQILPITKRPFYTSLFGALETISVLVGPILGGVLTEKLSWRWCFWISLPLGGVTLITITTCFPASRNNARFDSPVKELLANLDIFGNLSLVLAVVCLFLALSWGRIKYPWSEPRVWTLLIACVVLLGAFFWDQHRKKDKALLPLRLLSQRSVASGFAFTLLCSSVLNLFEYYMPI